LRRYNDNPNDFYNSSISILEEESSAEALHNLPLPDYEDTGFFPRTDLERDLRSKILGRYPVITVLGDGGNGKTALTLQTLYGLLASNDHPFDAFVWVSAKANRLSVGEVERIEGAITTSLGLLTEVADQFEPGVEAPLALVRRLMEDNRVLLVIDNLETVLDQTLRDMAADVPSKWATSTKRKPGDIFAASSRPTTSVALRRSRMISSIDMQIALAASRCS
jgi:LuxR family transcriptional regulator, glucitol operon activator